MPPTDRYPIARNLERMCLALKIRPERVLARVGLPADFAASEGRGVSAAQYFALWRAAEAEYGPEMAFDLAMLTSRGQFIPALFAFSCSPTVAVGFQRLALFKPLAGPFRLTIRTMKAGLRVHCSSLAPDEAIPDSLCAFELVFLLNMIRSLTGEQVNPLGATLPRYHGDKARLEAFLGCPLSPAEGHALVLSPAAAELPLISHDDALWQVFEPHLRRELEDRRDVRKTGGRVHTALIEMLPAGRASVEAVASHLGLSSRSLHRRLKEEGKTFQSILNSTREELSLHYLRSEAVSIEEISYLLAFRDPNSFYRAFRGWTGMTPGEARNRTLT